MAKAREVTTAFKVDISDLKKQIQDANKQIKLANSEFKAASAGMDDWSKDADGLSAKIKQLSTVIDNQKSILAEYERRYEQVVKEQGEGSKAAEDLKISINNMKAALKTNEAAVDKYNNALEELGEESDEAGDESKKAAKGVDDLGDAAKKAESKASGLGSALGSLVKGGLKVIGAGASALVGGFLASAEATKEYTAAMGKLDTAFTTNGHTAQTAEKTYKGLVGILGETDQAVEASNHLAKLTKNEQDLEKWTTICAGVYGTFGDSLPIEGLTEAANETAKTGALTGGLADALNWAGVSEDKFQAQLDKCNSEQERQALITNTLNGLYSEAADKYKELNADLIANNEATDNLNAAMAEVGKSAMPVMTTLKNFGASLLNEVMPSVKELGEGLKGIASGSEGAAEQIGGALSGILMTGVNKITEMLPAVADVAVTLVSTLIDSLTSVIPQLISTGGEVITTLISGALSMLPQLVTMAATIITSLLTTLGDMLPQIVNEVIKIVPQIIDALVAAAPLLINAGMTLLMSLVEALPTVIDNLVNSASTIVDSLVNGLITAMPQLLQGAITFFNAILEALPTVIQSLLGAMPQLINSIVSFLMTALPQLIQAAIQLFMALVEALPTVIQSLTAALPSVINAVINALVTAAPALLQGAIQLFMALVEALPVIIQSLIPELGNIIGTITGTLINNIPLLLECAVQLFMALVQAIPQIIAALIKALPQIITTIINTLKNLASSLWSSVLTPAINKFKDWGKEAKAKAKEAAKGFLDNTVSFLKNLPSKVWSFLGNAISKLITFATQARAKALEAGKNILSGVIDNIKNLPSKVWEWCKNAVSKVTSFASEAKTKAVQAGKNILNGVIDNIKNLPSKVRETAKNIVTGLWNGISDKFSWLTGKIKSFANDVTDKLKSFFGIHSPSRVMQDEIGKPIADGVAEGIKKNTNVATKAAKDMGTAVVKETTKSLEELDKARDGSLAAELAYWDALSEASEEGAETQVKAVKSMTEAQKELTESEQELLDNVTELLDTYMSELNNATNALMDSSDLFGKVEKNTEANAGDLLSNLRDQVKAYDEYWRVMSELRGRITSEGLQSALEEMGVDSLGELQALNSMTDSQLEEYSALYDTKYALCKQIATDNLSELRINTESQLAEMLGVTSVNLDAFAAVFNGTIDSIKLYITSTVTQIATLQTNMYNNGVNIVQGLINGMNSQKEALKGTVEEIINLAAEAAATAAQIHSPSRLFADKIGKFIPLGIAEGIKEHSDSVTGALQGLTVQSLNSAKSKLANGLTSGSSAKGTKASTGGVVNNYTFNQTNNSPKALSRKDIYRQTKNQFSQLKGASV